jgi:hypothetical protein
MGAKIYSYTPGNIESLYGKLMEIEELTLDEKEMAVQNNYEFVSKYFNQDKIANLQYEYFSELID